MDNDSERYFLSRTGGRFPQEILLYLFYDCEGGGFFKFFIYEGVYAFYSFYFDMFDGEYGVVFLTFTPTNETKYGRALYELEEFYVEKNEFVAELDEDEDKEEEIKVRYVEHDIAENIELYKEVIEEQLTQSEKIISLIEGIEKEFKRTNNYTSAVKDFFESNPPQNDFKHRGYISEINNWK